MYNATYFAYPAGVVVGLAISSGGSGGTEGTGLNEEQTQLLTDLAEWTTTRGYPGQLKQSMNELTNVQVWYDGIVPAKYKASVPAELLTSRENWNKILSSTQVQAAALVPFPPGDETKQLVVRGQILAGAIVPPNATIDDQLVNQRMLNLQMTSKADSSTVTTLGTRVNTVEGNVTTLQSKVVKVTQPGSQQAMRINALAPGTTYYCYPTSGYTASPPDTFSTTDWALLRIAYPVLNNIFEVCIVNLSTANKKIRVYCETPDLQYNAGQYVTFARGRNRNAIWSTAFIQPGSALRLVFYPKSTQMFQRNGVDVPGFVEFDEGANENSTLLPVNNT